MIVFLIIFKYREKNYYKQLYLQYFFKKLQEILIYLMYLYFSAQLKSKKS